VERLEEELSERLGTVVLIRSNRKGVGKLTLAFASLEQLEELLKRIR
jgi:ParB family chromosome partitioning protein